MSDCAKNLKTWTVKDSTLKDPLLFCVCPIKMSNKIVSFSPLIYGLPKEIKGCSYNFYNLEFAKTILFV